MYINLCEISFGSLAFKRDLYGPLMLAKRLSILIAEVAMYKERGSPQAKRERQQKRVMQGRVSAVRQEFSPTSQDAGLNHPRSRFLIDRLLLGRGSRVRANQGVLRRSGACVVLRISGERFRTVLDRKAFPMNLEEIDPALIDQAIQRVTSTGYKLQLKVKN